MPTPELRAQRCEACNQDTPRLAPDEIETLRGQVDADWEVAGGSALHRRFRFRDFASAMAFANQVAELAEQEGHHPDLRVGWGYLEAEITTHAIGGLSRNDFILAAKIDALRG
jgi:4a-hydroxytetrahydrobiopterin dehydratase